MIPPSSSSGPFPTTIWDRVRAAAHDANALALLLAVYRSPLIEHLHRTKIVSREKAEDLVHDFIAQRLLSKFDGDSSGVRSAFFAQADETRGRFRSYLLTALNHFCIDAARHAASLKESPNAGTESADDRLPAEADGPAESAFDVSLALRLLGHAIRRFEQDSRNGGRLDHWLLFEGRILPLLCGGVPVPFVELAERLRFKSEKQAANAYQTALNRFRHCWTEVLTEYLGADPAEESESLVAALFQAGPELLDGLRVHLWGELPAITRYGGRPHLTSELRDLMTLVAEKPGDLHAAMQRAMTAPLLAETGLAVDTFLDLFRHPDPGIESLTIAKETAKVNRSDVNSPLPPEIATALYYGAIAKALVRYGKSITEHDSTTVRKGFEWVAAQPWVDQELRLLAQSGVSIVQG